MNMCIEQIPGVNLIGSTICRLRMPLQYSTSVKFIQNSLLTLKGLVRATFSVFHRCYSEFLSSTLFYKDKFC